MKANKQKQNKTDKVLTVPAPRSQRQMITWYEGNSFITGMLSTRLDSLRICLFVYLYAKFCRLNLEPYWENILSPSYTPLLTPFPTLIISLRGVHV